MSTNIGFTAGYDDGLRDGSLDVPYFQEFPSSTHREYRKGYRAGWYDGKERKANGICYHGNPEKDCRTCAMEATDGTHSLPPMVQL